MSEHLQAPLLSKAGARHLFPTRRGGASLGPYQSFNLGGAVGDQPGHYESNMQRLAALVSVPREEVFTLWQVHGRGVREVAEGAKRRDLADQQGDALITQGPGRAVGVRTADCTPVLLFDPKTKAVAAIHAGWRGTVDDIAGATVEALQARYGARPSDILAAIGPCIGPCCFEVGPEVLDAFADSFSESTWRGLSLPNGKGTVDLYAANQAALRRAGVEQVEVLRACTRCDPEQRFFSYRRDGQHSGRHLSLITVPEDL